MQKTRSKFVVVEAAGTDDEKVVKRFDTFLAALKYAGRYGRNVDGIREAGVDVMREFADGTRTTEL